MFKDASIGDRVYCLMRGWGSVETISNIEGDTHPIEVRFVNRHDWEAYTLNGYTPLTSNTQMLYWDKPTITGGDTPPKRTININGYDVPEPVSGLEIGQRYWVAAPHRDKYCFVVFEYEEDPAERGWMARGFCHETEEDAAAHGKALASLTAPYGAKQGTTLQNNGAQGREQQDT